MKSNRKFVTEVESVSAVIGVILMVAITVALAATVYVFVGGILTPDSDKAPSIAFIQDDVADTLTVSKVSNSNVNWTSDIVITGIATKPTGFISAGQAITGCSGIVTVSYKGKTLIGSWTFTT